MHSDWIKPVFWSVHNSLYLEGLPLLLGRIDSPNKVLLPNLALEFIVLKHICHSITKPLACFLSAADNLRYIYSGPSLIRRINLANPKSKTS